MSLKPNSPPGIQFSPQFDSGEHLVQTRGNLQSMGQCDTTIQILSESETSSPELPVGIGTPGYTSQSFLPPQTTQQSGASAMTGMYTDLQQHHQMSQHACSKAPHIVTRATTTDNILSSEHRHSLQTVHITHQDQTRPIDNTILSKGQIPLSAPCHVNVAGTTMSEGINTKYSLPFGVKSAELTHNKPETTNCGTTRTNTEITSQSVQPIVIAAQ